MSAFPPNQYIWVGCYIRQIVFFIDQYFAVEYNYKSNVYSKEGWHIGILEFYCLSSSLEWDILSHVTPLQFCCLDSTSGSSAKYKTLVGKSLSLSYRALWLQAPKDKKKLGWPLWNLLNHFGTLTSLPGLAILGPRLAIFWRTPAIEVKITKSTTVPGVDCFNLGPT